MAGTEKIIGFKTMTQRPLNEWYLNNAVAWATEAAVLAGIPSGSRSDGLKVRIGLVDYEFMADLATLQAVAYANDQTASEVPIVDTGDLFTATEVEAALAEVKAQVNATDATITGLGSGTIQVTYTILLPTAETVALRIAGAVTKPTEWTLAANATVNLLVTHNLTGRKVSSVNVWEIDGANQRLLKPFEAAYSGCLVNLVTCLIEGLATTALAIRIEIIIPA